MKRSPQQAYRIRVALRIAALVCLWCYGILAETVDAQYRAQLGRSREHCAVMVAASERLPMAVTTGDMQYAEALP